MTEPGMMVQAPRQTPGSSAQQKVAHCERVGGHNFLTDYLPKLDRHNPYFLLVVGTPY